jgi:uncharacterized membrane protein
MSRIYDILEDDIYELHTALVVAKRIVEKLDSIKKFDMEREGLIKTIESAIEIVNRITMTNKKRSNKSGR